MDAIVTRVRAQPPPDGKRPGAHQKESGNGDEDHKNVEHRGENPVLSEAGRSRKSRNHNTGTSVYVFIENTLFN